MPKEPKNSKKEFTCRECCKEYNISHRPPKYDPRMCETFIELSKTGMQPCEIAAHLGVTKRMLNYWATDESKPEFMQAFEYGRTCCEAFHLDKGRKGTYGELQGKFIPISYIYTMKVCFGHEYKEDGTRNQLEITNKYQNMTEEQLRKAIEQKLSFNTINITKDSQSIEMITDGVSSE